MTNIIWTNERRKLKDLKPWERNPRQITKDQAKRLVESFDEFGQVETIAIGPNNEVYNGHQRLNVLKDKYGEDYEVEVRVSSRELTEKQREKLTVYLHKGAAGVWDFDTLANEFELDDLLEWGFSEMEFGIHPDIDFDEFDGEGDGGGSRMMNGDKVRVVLGALMFDIPDPDRSIYKLTEEADEGDVRDKLLSLIAMGELP